MESNIQNETAMNEVISSITPTAEEMATQPTSELEGTAPGNEAHDANHPHHAHNSALGAAAKAHSAVHHVMPHHRRLDI